jgi:hypothetical protein
MRILVINPIWPCSTHGVRGANVCIYEIVARLAREPAVKTGFLKLNLSNNETPNAVENSSIRELTALGVEFLDPAILKPSGRRSRLSRWLLPREADFYPTVEQRTTAEQAAMEFRPDAIFVQWSEIAAALFANFPAKKFAYYGNPDAKSAWARANFERNHGRSLGAYALDYIQVQRMERFHLANMGKYDYIGNVSANDADYYRSQGHSNAFYLRNLWIDRVGTRWRAIREGERTEPLVIVGNLGKLAATANTHGLEILGRDILPQLRRALAAHPFEVHVFGAGAPHPAIAPVLAAPEVRMRGFVDDIDTELMTAPVFLCVNNASGFKVGHTRYLHAWSLGGCVVGHSDAALSMPEMVSGENCLLGRTAAEIADMVAAVSCDVALRRRLGEAGYATFVEKFTAGPIVDQILARIRAPASVKEAG